MRVVLIAARSLFVLAFVAALPWPAAAQIYSWRDANGNLMLSNKPPAGAARAYATPRASAPFRTTRRAEVPFPQAYDALIARHAAAYGVSADLVRAVMQVESGFNPRAVSSKGAMGLMQLMPSTAIEMGVAKPFDPDQNIRGGVAYLRGLLNRYAGDVSLALAAYNAGPGVVARHDYQVPPYAETRNYVSRVMTRSSGGPNVVVAGGTSPSRTFAGAKAQTDTAPTARAAAQASAPATRPRPIYKTVEIIAGRPVTKFSDARPATGSYEVLSRR